VEGKKSEAVVEREFERWNVRIFTLNCKNL
jgi:hypothetical protein